MQLTHEAHYSNKPTRDIILLCDHIHSPANQGALFRLADAFGVKEVIFIGQAPDTKSARLKRTARSTQSFIPYTSYEDALLPLEGLKKEGYQCLSLEITENSIPLSTVQITQEKILLVVGNEQNGISQAILETMDVTMHIAMFGNNSSMNVAQAAAIALYHISQ